ncbi:MAG: sensor histidine kinase [Bacteroidetes bacterium]|nr:sensor histidine kinase [Bacteroidota bacterium]
MNSYYNILRHIIFLTLSIFASFGTLASDQTVKNENEEVHANITQATKFYNNYQFDSAVIYYDLALIQARQQNDPVMISHLLCLKGRALSNAGQQYDLAYKLYLQARDQAIELKNDSLCAIADIGIAHIYEDRGLLDSAEYHLNHALLDYKKLLDTIGIGKAKQNLSSLYVIKVDYEKSLKYALESNRIFKQFGQRRQQAKSLINLGNIYHYLKEYDSALSCYEESYALSMELNDLRIASSANSNKGVIYYHYKEYEKAKEAFLKSIQFSEKINDVESLTSLYRSTSIILKWLGDYEGALELSERSLAFARKIDNKELESGALLNLGVLHKQNDNFDQAEKYYLDGISVAEAYHLLWDMQIGYENITLLYVAKDDYKTAYQYQQKYLDVTDSIHNHEQISAREKYKAEYELLHYRDQNRIKEFEKKKMLFQRNLSFGIGLAVIVLLLLILLFLRMQIRKNRIIAQQKIQKLEDEKKLMAAQSVMVGQEKERERIARELHDGIGVLLSTASIHFSSVEEKSDAATSEMLQKANKLLKDASKEVRQISHNMMPSVLSKFGLEEAIEDLCEDVEEAGDMTVDLHLSLEEERLPENMEIMIYRIIQEMLNNAIKHAQASKVNLSLIKRDKEILIAFKDDGVGFDESSLPHGKNLGLSGIRSRIEYMGGRIELQSQPGKGTSYSIAIPVRTKTD